MPNGSVENIYENSRLHKLRLQLRGLRGNLRNFALICESFETADQTF